MGAITARQLHLETRRILDELDSGKPLLVTRNGRRLEPLSPKQPQHWDDIMADVWHAQKRIRGARRMANPVLAERQRRRR